MPLGASAAVSACFCCPHSPPFSAPCWRPPCLDGARSRLCIPLCWSRPVLWSIFPWFLSWIRRASLVMCPAHGVRVIGAWNGVQSGERGGDGLRARREVRLDKAHRTRGVRSRHFRDRPQVQHQGTTVRRQRAMLFMFCQRCHTGCVDTHIILGVSRGGGPCLERAACSIWKTSIPAI